MGLKKSVWDGAEGPLGGLFYLSKDRRCSETGGEGPAKLEAFGTPLAPSALGEDQ